MLHIKCKKRLGGREETRNATPFTLQEYNPKPKTDRKNAGSWKVSVFFSTHKNQKSRNTHTKKLKTEPTEDALQL